MKVLRLMVGVGIVAAVVVALMLRNDSPEMQTQVNQPSAAAVGNKGGALEILRGSEFDLNYGSSRSTPRGDLELLQGLLGNAWLLVKDVDRIPLADNRDFARFLGGENPHRVAWIPPDHRSLNDSGEIIDRWGTPLFFHRISSRHTELRSAGPDREFWNEDDLSLRPESRSYSE